MIRLLIVDDHHLVRMGIRTLLAQVDDIEVVAEAADGMEAITFFRHNGEADLILMDLEMPRCSGLEATRRILLTQPQVKILILTACKDEVRPLRVLRAGASGYLTKGSDKQTLIDVIHQIIAGKCYLEPRIVEGVVRQSLIKQTTSPFDQLSDREFEIMLMLIEGKEIDEISVALALGSNTIKDYRKRLFQRLNIKKESEMIRLAIQYKLTS